MDVTFGFGAKRGWGCIDVTALAGDKIEGWLGQRLDGRKKVVLFVHPLRQQQETGCVTPTHDELQEPFDMISAIGRIGNEDMMGRNTVLLFPHGVTILPHIVHVRKS